ncbi:hypothetical protein ANCCAN_17201 [Ancylostoma caninum]|uniref:Uncharacterized protein n=1 Tax=Ancylostoma caninum TaxID=29170 RepID=A0A368G1S0_ANCCA|nr:hypothetical protein ANCCAN_17201 [Ancylostoma caninum]
MKVVTSKDIRIFKGSGVHVLLSLLHTLGAHFVDSLIYSVLDCNVQLPRLPTFRLLEEWDLLPSSRKLFPVPSPGAQDVVLDMIHAVVQLQPEIVYVVSLMETKASQIGILYRDRPTNNCTLEMRRFVRHIAKKYQSIVNVKDFEFVLAAYALKIFGRWVRDETKNQPSSIGNEGDRTLLIMLVRKRRVQISPTDALSALDEWKNLFRTVENFVKPQKISCFESPRALCIALRIHFEYARASKGSDQWVKDCDIFFKHSEQCVASDDRAVIVGAFLDVLEYHWKTYHTQKEKLLEVLEKGQILCPYDGSLIRRRINLSSGVMEKFRIQHMLANAPTRNGNFFDWTAHLTFSLPGAIVIAVLLDPTLDMYSSLARLYLEKNRIAKLIEAGALPNSDVVATITRAEASQRMDPALWRLALAQAKSLRFLNETHVLASAQCGWSRHLHIDCVALSNSTRKCKEIMSLMEERGVYVFNDLDYLQELKSTEQMEL